MNFSKCFISLLVLFITVSNCATCKSSQCVAIGQECSTNSTKLVCDSSSYCSENGICEPLSQLGGPCESSDECGNNKLGYTLPGVYSCVDSVCSLVGVISVNGFCNTSADCLSDPIGNLPCVDGKCQGRSEGEPCTTASTCKFGLYCNTSSVCSPNIPLGEACDASSLTYKLSVCGPGNVCSSSSVCIQQFSRPTGSPCVLTQECGGGNICIEGTCAAPPGLKLCNASADCPRSEGYYGCYCKQNGTQECYTTLVNEPRCTSQIDALAACMAKYQCKDIETNEKSCSWENCPGESSCYWQCTLGQSMEYYYRFGCYKTYGCTSTTTTGSSSDSTTTGSDSSVTTLSPILFFVLVIAQVLFV